MFRLFQTGGAVVTKRLFEVTLFVAAVFETAHLVGLFDRRAEVDGALLATVFTFGAPWLALLLGLAITRAGSSVAKWVLVALTLIVLLSAVRIGAGRWAEPAILAGAIAGLLQIAAAAMLFMPSGRQWTRKPPTV